MDSALTARLTVELVPRSCWASNVRTIVSQPEWDVVRRMVYVRAGYQCELCGGRGEEHPVECHERWFYDDATRVQRLVRMVGLCPACHDVKHIGLAEIRDRGGAAFGHLMWVNGWTPEQTRAYLDLAMARWRRRSKVRWALDLSVLAQYGVMPRDGHEDYFYPAGGINARIGGREFQGVEPGARSLGTTR